MIASRIVTNAAVKESAMKKSRSHVRDRNDQRDHADQDQHGDEKVRLLEQTSNQGSGNAVIHLCARDISTESDPVRI